MSGASSSSSAKSAAPPAAAAAASRTQTPPRAATKPSTAEGDPAAFRRFFTQLSTADIHAGSTAVTNGAAAKSSASASAPAAAALSASLHAPPHAQEAYRQLHSSMPALHAHHLECLGSWLGEAFSARRLPAEIAPGEPFILSLALIEAVRNQARLAPAHSRLAGAASLTTPGGVALKATPAAGADEAEEPSFAEALAADAGKATAALSRRRGADGSSSSASSSSAASQPKSDAAEVTLSAATNPVDSRMAAASQLYAVMLVQLLPLLLHPASSSSSVPAAAAASSASSTTTPRDFLRAIPRSLEAEAQRLKEEAAAHLAAVVCFDDTELIEAPETEMETEGKKDEDSDDDFTADPQPDSDDESAAATAAWGSLDSIPIEAHAIAARHAPAPSVSKGSDAAALRDQILQLVSLWDADLFTLGSVWSDARIAEHLVRTWELASREREGGAFHPSSDAGCAALHQLRHRILAVFRAGLLQQQHPQSQFGAASSSMLQQMWIPLVSSLLGLPQCVPGMGADPVSLMSDLPEDEEEDSARSNSRFDAEATLISLLSQVCSASTAVPFPANPSAAPLAYATSAASISFLHSFVSHNLRWLSRRLGQLRGQFTEMIDQAREQWNSLRFVCPRRLRRIVDQMHEITHIAAFWVSNHPALNRGGRATGELQQPEDLGVSLIESGMLSHVVALALLSNHDLFHSHGSAAGASAEAYCASCRAFEAARAATDVQLVASVTKQGQYVSEIRAAVSAFAAPAAAASSSTPAAAAGSIALPSASPSSNPLYFVHHLLLVCCSWSPAVCAHVLSHPTFLSRASCACYEEQQMVPAMLMPIVISLHTRSLQVEAAHSAALAGAIAASAAASPSSSAAAPAAPAVAKKKDKKSKLLISALSVDSDEKQDEEAADTAAVIKDEDAARLMLSWSSSSSGIGSSSSVDPIPSHNAQSLLALLTRCAHILRSTLAVLPVAAAASSSASVMAAAPVSTPPIDAAALSLHLQLLSHVVHHLSLLVSRSSHHKTLLLRLSVSSVAASEYPPERQAECALVSQILQMMLKQLRAMLPALSKQLVAELTVQAAPSIAEPAAATAVDAAGDDTAAASAHLTALSAESDSAAGHSRRQVKQSLEQCVSAVQQLQQWCKTMAVEVAKKD